MPAENEVAQNMSQNVRFSDAERFLDHFGGETKKLFVQNLELPNNQVEPEEWTVAKVREGFLSDQYGVFNCLDVPVDSPLVQHRLQPLLDTDLLRAPRYPNDLVGWTKQQAAPLLAERRLLSKRGAISAIHVDGGGPVTHLTTLFDSRLLYWMLPLPLMPMKDVDRFMSREMLDPLGYEAQWSRLLLGPGDMLIMPSGTPYAVYTPTDSLCIRGFCLPGHQVPRSLTTVALLDEHDDLVNDSPPSQLFDTYSDYYLNFVRPRKA